ncbi:MAG TPA: L,D-transpeptidase family protein, partial [Flavisolibacter sp.]|nr:L,D-transpeptidase family protein [Flavisolibacter sp.]
MATTISYRNTLLLFTGFLLSFQVAFTRSSLNDDPNFTSFTLLQQELSRYAEIEKNGGWRKIVLHKKYYSRGQSAPEILQVKERLSASGHYTSSDNTPLFTEDLYMAVRKTQKSFGLVESGVIDAPLIKELNVPVELRLQQLLINIERLKSMPAPTAGTRLIANIPEFKLHVYEGAEHIFDMDIIVGKGSTKTISFSDEMKYIIFSPYWNVPPSIVKDEILPAARKSSTYLKRNRYEIVGTEGGLPKIRQQPGPDNSLGLVKFIFPNSHN